MKCHIRPIRFEIRFEFESLLPIRFVFDSNANGLFAGPYLELNNLMIYYRVTGNKRALVLLDRPSDAIAS